MRILNVARRSAFALLVLSVGCVAPTEDRPAGDIPEIGPGAAGVPRTVVWVSVAGLTPDRYLGEAPVMPVLAEMARVGVAAERIESVTPASAYPVHASWMTGLPPNIHGVTADRRIGERGVRPTPHRHASLLRAVALWTRVAEAGRGVLALDWPGTQGADIAGLIPDVGPERPGQSWAELAAEGSSPGLVDEVRASPVAGRRADVRDDLLTGIACAALGSANAPSLVLLRLRHTEAPLVRSGPRSPATRASFGAVDRRIATLLECAGDQSGQTTFIIGGDVAYEPVHTMLRPNALLAEGGIASGGGAGWQALVRSNGGSAFVYARDEPSALAARRLLGKAAERSGGFRVVGAEEMIARNADPEAWFGLAAAQGFAFVDDPNGVFESPARMRGAGGYLEEPGRPTAGIVMFGRGVRSGVRVPVISTLDVGPTVGKLLGVSLEPAIGRPRFGFLRLGGDQSAE
jgi:hypothetical protein